MCGPDALRQAVKKEKRDRLLQVPVYRVGAGSGPWSWQRFECWLTLAVTILGLCWVVCSVSPWGMPPFSWGVRPQDKQIMGNLLLFTGRDTFAVGSHEECVCVWAVPSRLCNTEGTATCVYVCQLNW